MQKNRNNVKWFKNLKSLSECGIVGSCPFCGSNDTGYNAVNVVADMGYVTVWCNECKKSYIVSRTKITAKMDNGQDTPKEIL